MICVQTQYNPVVQVMILPKEEVEQEGYIRWFCRDDRGEKDSSFEP